MYVKICLFVNLSMEESNLNEEQKIPGWRAISTGKVNASSERSLNINAKPCE